VPAAYATQRGEVLPRPSAITHRASKTCRSQYRRSFVGGESHAWTRESPHSDKIAARHCAAVARTRHASTGPWQDSERTPLPSGSRLKQARAGCPGQSQTDPGPGTTVAEARLRSWFIPRAIRIGVRGYRRAIREHPNLAHCNQKATSIGLQKRPGFRYRYRGQCVSNTAASIKPSNIPGRYVAAERAGRLAGSSRARQVEPARRKTR
jgi:hypothetical protein